MTDEPAVAAGVESHATADEVRGWIGARLDDFNGAPAGWVDGAYVDAAEGGVEWLLVRRGRFGGHCLVPAREAVEAAGHVWVPWDRATIRGSPGVEPGEPLTADRELELCAHYGIREGVGRAADVAARSPADASSRPA
jgi:hypothetical protein